MTYAEALKTLNDAADYARNQRALCAQLSELKEAKQRLTAAYGVERVNSTPVYQNPAQKALEMQDNALEEMTGILDYGLKAFTQASDIIKKLPTFKQRSVLNMHYCLGMSHRRIAKALGKSESTAKRSHAEALETLRTILEGKSL